MIAEFQSPKLQGFIVTGAVKGIVAAVRISGTDALSNCFVDTHPLTSLFYTDRNPKGLLLLFDPLLEQLLRLVPSFLSLSDPEGPIWTPFHPLTP
jgi:hypothetical protein